MTRYCECGDKDPNIYLADDDYNGLLVACNTLIDSEADIYCEFCEQPCKHEPICRYGGPSFRCTWCNEEKSCWGLLRGFAKSTLERGKGSYIEYRAVTNGTILASNAEEVGGCFCQGNEDSDSDDADEAETLKGRLKAELKKKLKHEILYDNYLIAKEELEEEFEGKVKEALTAAEQKRSTNSKHGCIQTDPISRPNGTDIGTQTILVGSVTGDITLSILEDLSLEMQRSSESNASESAVASLREKLRRQEEMMEVLVRSFSRYKEEVQTLRMERDEAVRKLAAAKEEGPEAVKALFEMKKWMENLGGLRLMDEGRVRSSDFEGPNSPADRV
ncbi:hypothetical protein BJ508DRAFT_367434 [Ascobolus immersus RN42]|uniref:Uncharacterized protein n=1 Tax=Ascobolus immersus RN42 TaxID=1160509 RepID=A0A3N4HCN4_ASCIM|nr:hypothetical protein BJ508DRAFT_367434 [Ascobolus immersus RN42]